MTDQTKTPFDCRPVEDWLESERAAGRLSGGVMEIRQAGATVFSSTFGTKDTEGTPVTADTAYWIASMTKPIVSVAAMRLVEQGHFGLSAPVRNFIPGFGENGVLSDDGTIVDAVRPPVIRDLMTHVSGVTYGQFGNETIHGRYLEKKVYDFFSDNARMAARLSELPLLHQPGTVFEYGMSTDLLGRVIEVVTGTGLDSALKTLVLDPLAMNDTGFLPDPVRIAVLPPSPTQRALAPPLTPEQTWFSGGGGLCSTVPDYMRFAEMLRQGGALEDVRLLRSETLTTMLRDHLPPDVGYGSYTGGLGITAPTPENGLGFGLGFAVRTERRDHLCGGLGEFLWPGVSGANFWVDPENDLITVFLTHAPEHRGQHRIGLRNAVYAGLKQD